MPLEILPAGDRAFLAELGEVTAAGLHASAVAVRRISDVIAAIPGQQSVYVVFGRETGSADRERVAAAIESATELHVESRHHSIEVSFDGADAPDLDELLTAQSMSRAEFEDRVRRLTLTARYLGFRAGFAYLDGWPEEWRMPRRPTSRPRVPAGTFAIAAASAGFYAVESPGGWNLLGRTAAPLWDPRRTPPNMISAGDEISIVPVNGLRAAPAVNDEMLPPPPIKSIQIVANGQFAKTVAATDWDLVDEGLAPGGPFDEAAAAAARAVAGAPNGATLLECAMLGPKVRFSAACVIAWAGAESDLPQLEAIKVESGEEVNVGRIRGGLRGWLAIGRGGQPAAIVRSDDDRFTIRVAAGPHPASLREVECEVTPQLNRVGIRMRPLTALAIEAPAELPSSGMQFGTIQLHPDGTLVAMGPDCPVTGGYLQPMTVLWDERWKLAQLSPGERVRFVSR